MNYTKLKSISNVLTVIIIVSIIAALGSAQVNAKVIQKSIKNKTIIGESFAEKGSYNGTVKSKNLSGITIVPSAKKTLALKKKKINNRNYFFKIIRKTSRYEKKSTKKTNVEKNQSNFDNLFTTKRKVDICAVIPKIKGYKLVKSKRKVDPRPTGTGSRKIKNIVVNKPQNDTVISKKTKYDKSYIGGAWISKIKKSRNKIKVTYSFQVRYRHEELTEKIIKTSNNKHKKVVKKDTYFGQHVNLLKCVYKKIK